ncbi:LuxR family transcriptional regulator [Paroceanicella profunda]|uniref:LuxR family transcriptional regulator n=1 Tax=Paroceanicella profunda TaxID=2579971 RepID=A0A5B8FGT9_9RHOB|nr:autoinducer binding domain-containing protein [Paroceanicella profunda]QDL91387.1 LuxR family transcriptional regulator [Paroceanicella profunda]
MLHALTDHEHEFHTGMTVDAAMEVALALLRPEGFDIATYDFSPVPLSHEGEFITPAVLSLCNAPEDMEGLWCRGGYYQIDPVMEASLAVSRPFAWAHGGRQSPVMRKVLAEKHSPVVSYLHDTRMTCGITVPIRAEGGALATFSAIRLDPERAAAGDAEQLLAAVGQLGRIFHDAVYPGFDAATRTSRHIRLTPRERQCLRLCAAGLTTKQIAHELSRSVPTVTLHLNSATRKLGARNRFQAIARAAHYRLLEPDA